MKSWRKENVSVRHEKMRKENVVWCSWLLLLLHGVLVLHGDHSHHFLLYVRDLAVDLPDYVIDGSLVGGNETFQWWKTISNMLRARKPSKRIFAESFEVEQPTKDIPDCSCIQEAEWRIQPMWVWWGSSYWTFKR